MDPPSYGRGPSGETCKIEEDVADFVELTMGVLSDKPLFVLISSYSTGLAPSVMSYLLGITAGRRAAGRIEAQEHMLAAYPSLQGMHQAGDGNTQIFAPTQVTATFSSFTEAPRPVTVSRETETETPRLCSLA